VDAFVLSYEVGVMKPGAGIFSAACSALGVAPQDALMVGDNPRADGGACDLGMRTLLLPYSPAGREHGLRAVLDLVDAAVR
jgi:HAD superfamily hydrolase (TIGR01509 family)